MKGYAVNKRFERLENRVTKIDESVLLLLSKRQARVNAQIYTRRISAQLHLYLKKHNSQYEQIHIKTSDTFHDRFLIVDNTVYNIEASLKDLGKKLFAFSKTEIKSMEIFSIGKI
jgi:hypothetical protein